MKLFRLTVLIGALLICLAYSASGGEQGIPVTAPAAVIALPTATPFQPVAPTVTAPAPTTAQREAFWQSMDFTGGRERITVAVAAPELPIQVDFRPGWPCAYIDQTACVGQYADGFAPVLLATVHSGVGGDGQPLRHALEGTGWNSAGLPLVEISANLVKLRGAPVTIRQAGIQVDGLWIITALRVPPEGLGRYLSQPVTTSLAEFAQSDPFLAEALGEPLLVIETCGWRHLEEAGRWPVDDTTGSIYLLVIGR